MVAEYLTGVGFCFVVFIFLKLLGFTKSWEENDYEWAFVAIACWPVSVPILLLAFVCFAIFVFMMLVIGLVFSFGEFLGRFFN